MKRDHVPVSHGKNRASPFIFVAVTCGGDKAGAIGEVSRALDAIR